MTNTTRTTRNTTTTASYLAKYKTIVTEAGLVSDMQVSVVYYTRKDGVQVGEVAIETKRAGKWRFDSELSIATTFKQGNDESMSRFETEVVSELVRRATGSPLVSRFFRDYPSKIVIGERGVYF